jgi:hypothetical protein
MHCPVIGVADIVLRAIDWSGGGPTEVLYVEKLWTGSPTEFVSLMAVSDCVVGESVGAAVGVGRAAAGVEGELDEPPPPHPASRIAAKAAAARVIRMERRLLKRSSEKALRHLRRATF